MKTVINCITHMDKNILCGLQKYGHLIDDDGDTENFLLFAKPNNPLGFL